MANGWVIFVLIPLVQGRFLFAGLTWINIKPWSLNPFGSGTFFIRCAPCQATTCQQGLNPFGSGTFFILMPILEKALAKHVLIPLVQGRFLFAYLLQHCIMRVLIPLVQGRFLFPYQEENIGKTPCLNPFGSGTFFILRAGGHSGRWRDVLIPLVQGRFLFSLFWT